MNYQDFKQLKTPEEYVRWVKFKMEIIAQFYEEFCARSIIGLPIDVIDIKND